MDLLAPASAEKRSLAMAGWTKGLCLSQAVLGVAFAYSATMHFYSYTQTTGQLIGLLMVATAVAGALGAAKKSRPLLAGYLVGVLLAMLLTFAFVGQVSREVEVDCALAQLEIRVEALERSEQGAGHHALFGSLFTRLDEMEGLLDMVQHGTAHVVHHRSEQKNLAVTDRACVVESKQGGGALRPSSNAAAVDIPLLTQRIAPHPPSSCSTNPQVCAGKDRHAEGTRSRAH